MILPIPHIITHLGKLVSSSLQQLDTAFRPPTEIVNDNQTIVFTPSPLIEYPDSFRTTLLQMSQMLSNALRTANNDANKMSIRAESATSNINSVLRYLPRYQSSPRFADLVTSPLNRLNESSSENLQLASEGATEFQNLAKLTDAVFDVVFNSIRVKKEHVRIVNANITSKTESKCVVEKEMLFLNETNRKLTELLNDRKQAVLSNVKSFFSRLLETSGETPLHSLSK